MKVKFEIDNLKLKLKLNILFENMSVKIVSLFIKVKTSFASIVIYRVLLFIFKAIEILFFFASVGAVY